MKTSISRWFFFGLVWSFFPVASAQDWTSDCNQIEITYRKQPIPYKAFPMSDPRTGRTYQPDEEIEIVVQGTKKKVKARELFDQINLIEKALNEMGYTLRAGGAQTLSALNYCADLLNKQHALIRQSLKDFASDVFSLQWKQKLEDAWKTYSENVLPSWSELEAAAQSSDFYFKFPPVPPVYAPSVPELKPAPLNVKKEKRWSFEKGDPEKLHVSLTAGFAVRGDDKTALEASADGLIKGSVFGKEQEVLSANAYAKSPGHEQGSASASLRVLGKDVFPPWSQKVNAVDLKDQKEAAVDFKLEHRGSLGPIPYKAEIGAKGIAGFQWGFNLVPFQAQAYVQPYAKAVGYGNAGADIFVAGIGVGGELKFIDVVVPIIGRIALECSDVAQIVYSLKSDINLEVLSGRLYIFAFLDYFFDKAEWQEDIIKWTGPKLEKTIFHYEGKLSSLGLVASGDLSAEDFAEMQQASTLTERVDALNTAEQDTYKKLGQALEAIHADLLSDQQKNALVQTEVARAAIQGQDQTLEAWTRTLASLAY